MKATASVLLPVKNSKLAQRKSNLFRNCGMPYLKRERVFEERNIARNRSASYEQQTVEVSKHKAQIQVVQNSP
jgi:hypothetical protein